MIENQEQLELTKKWLFKWYQELKNSIPFNDLMICLNNKDIAKVESILAMIDRLEAEIKEFESKEPVKTIITNLRFTKNTNIL